MLERDPAHTQSLLGISLVALASRQIGAALQVAAAATATAPETIEAWIVLGQALTAASRFEEAERAYAQALLLDDAHGLVHLGLGELRFACGRPEDAITEYRLALRSRASSPAAHLGLGNALASLHRDREALRSYEQAVKLAPRLPEIHFGEGFVLARLGRAAEAEARYRRALFLRPNFATAWLNLGMLLLEQDRDPAAEWALCRAAELRPDLISPWINLAMLERHRGRADKEQKHLLHAFALDLSRSETLIAWSQFRFAERDLAGAWRWLQWALAQNPAHGEALNMQGILLHAEGRFGEAIEAFKCAEAIGISAAASNRGNSLMEMGNISAAVHAHETAVARDQTCAGARYNLALLQLRAGDWAHGWPNYEARWRFRKIHRRPLSFRQPRWQGEPLDGRRILLHAEQGLGDTIQFCRYTALVAQRGGMPVLAVQEPVERLMHTLADVRAGRAHVVSLGKEASASNFAFDCECPLMSLPAVFGTTLKTVPWSGAYLAVDHQARHDKMMEYPDRIAGPRIGVAWAGNPRYQADAERSTRLTTMLPLLRGFEANWFSLQKGAAAAQIADLPPDILLHDASRQDRDLDETAALVATLDLVITTDTSIAHLAGAMAKPVWILLPHVADWRWMESIEETPWYPTARLFRQPVRGDWPAVVDRVLKALEKLHMPGAQPPAA
jgi:tetratricopeptide (TPR) repeat protein